MDSEKKTRFSRLNPQKTSNIFKANKTNKIDSFDEKETSNNKFMKKRFEFNTTQDTYSNNRFGRKPENNYNGSQSFNDRKRFNEPRRFDDRKRFNEPRRFDDRKRFNEPQRFDDRKRFNEPQRFDNRKRFNEPQRFDNRKRFNEPQRFDDWSENKNNNRFQYKKKYSRKNNNHQHRSRMENSNFDPLNPNGHSLFNTIVEQKKVLTDDSLSRKQNIEKTRLPKINTSTNTSNKKKDNMMIIKKDGNLVKKKDQLEEIKDDDATNKWLLEKYSYISESSEEDSDEEY